MATTLLLRLLLDSDKLMGSNFDSWYQKLKIVLEHEWIQYVLMDPAPKEPTFNARGTIEILIRSGLVIESWYAALYWLP